MHSSTAMKNALIAQTKAPLQAAETAKVSTQPASSTIQAGMAKQAKAPPTNPATKAGGPNIPPAKNLPELVTNLGKATLLGGTK